MRRGFTLVELLLVVAIIGIVAAVVAPRLGGLLEGGQVAVAARVVSQSGRYARSMALMHQVPIDLVIDAGRGRVRVEAVVAEKSGGAEAGGAGFPGMEGLSEYGFRDAQEAGGAVDFGRAVSKNERHEALRGLGLRSSRTPDIELADEPELEGGMAEQIALERELEGVRLSFGGYNDRADLGFEDEERGSARIRYRANGTCRPYSVVVAGVKTGERFVVDVDAVGGPAILHGEEALRRLR